MLFGIIAMAAAAEQALAHPNEPLELILRIALGAGAVLFVCGTAAAMWRATGRTHWSRWALAPAGALAVIAFGAVPWIAMTMIFGMLLAVGVAEEVPGARD